MSGKVKREWHPNFLKYMQFIINHDNYSGMPELYKKDGTIRWVVTRKSEIGQKRLRWWNKKREELGIKKRGAWISRVARAIHPTGEKPCQICGKVLQLDYVYKNKRGTLSPGAMSNAPDRLDGYHSYNLCCRGKHDTGRHKTNLSRYGEDRRVYENWSDGDWKAASWLMKEFNKHGVSPDHIGPLSLGFAHRPKFNPVTLAENTAKNNRMSLSDVRSLLEDEKNGEIVISAHSKSIWDRLKFFIKDNDDALKVCKLMRINLHNILKLFYQIHKDGHDKFLIDNFLHPEYANFFISFSGFNPDNGTYKEIIKKSGNKKQYTNNAKRYIRKSIEALEKYDGVENRNTKILNSKTTKDLTEQLFSSLRKQQYKKARKNLDEIFKALAENAYQQFK